ncbi:hypothetical protein BDW68DRAFT_149400 [Aspergillus falconensis]
MLQAAEGGWPAMLPLQLNISAACADESVLRKTLLAILLLEQARKEAGCFSVVVHTALYRRQWKEETSLKPHTSRMGPKTPFFQDLKMTMH